MNTLRVVWTAAFKKDYKKAMRRGLDINKLDDVIRSLALQTPLPEKHKDHALIGEWAGHRGCHVAPDWLLIYRIDGNILVLTLSRTGTHADLFRE